MTPTAKLRFVERKIYVNKPAFNAYGNEGTVSEMVKKIILQQWWASNGSTANEIRFELNGEWRDVPLEEEK